MATRGPARGRARHERRPVPPGLRRARAPADAAVPRLAGARRRCATSPSTRRTASATGDTTSARSIASSPSSRRACPAPACAPTPRPPPSACASDIAAQLRARRSAGAGRRLRSAQPGLPRRPPRRFLPAGARGAAPPRRPGGDRLLPEPARDRGAGRAGSAEQGLKAAHYHAGMDAGAAPPDAGSVRRGAARHRRRHRRIRHGHRSQRRALRHPRRPAEVDRALPTGDRPRRPRRARGGMRPALLAAPTSCASST